MMIKDKQTLRRCVKQAVRRAEIVETALGLEALSGGTGIARSRGCFALPGTPFSPDAAALCAALDALGLPAYDLDRAEDAVAAYEKDAYLRALADAARLKRAFVRAPFERAGEPLPEDDRFEIALTAGARAFPDGRFGTDYAEGARALSRAVRESGARELCCEEPLELSAVLCGLIPVCEEEGCRLHVGIGDERALALLAERLDRAENVRAVVWSLAGGALERALIEAARERPRMIVRLTSTENLVYALERLGTRFIAYASCAPTLELMTGRWLNFKERLHPLLAEAYLPLARTGYALTSEAVERDVRAILGGCLCEGAQRDEKRDA